VAKVLYKYDVTYGQCTECRFIQTEEPYWLSEAYTLAIAACDIGIVSRCIRMAELTSSFIDADIKMKGPFLDYGGGYGLFTRLMRDRGYNFFHDDKYCSNLFAQYFDLVSNKNAGTFDMVTLFEVMEHTTNPLSLLERLSSLADSILFTTELLPLRKIHSVEDWWYFAPQTGQHISFFSEQSLRNAAINLGFHLFTNGKSIHFLTKRDFSFDPLKKILKPSLLQKMHRTLFKKKYRRHSLLPKDFETITNILNHSKNNA